MNTKIAFILGAVAAPTRSRRSRANEGQKRPLTVWRDARPRRTRASGLHYGVADPLNKWSAGIPMVYRAQRPSR